MTFKVFMNALKETIFNIAVLHLVLLAVYVGISGDFSFFSMASILDMKLFFPDVDYGSTTLALMGLLPVLMLWGFHYFRLLRKMPMHK